MRGEHFQQLPPLPVAWGSSPWAGEVHLLDFPLRAMSPQPSSDHSRVGASGERARGALRALAGTGRTSACSRSATVMSGPLRIRSSKAACSGSSSTHKVRTWRSCRSSVVNSAGHSSVWIWSNGEVFGVRVIDPGAMTASGSCSWVEETPLISAHHQSVQRPADGSMGQAGCVGRTTGARGRSRERSHAKPCSTFRHRLTALGGGPTEDVRGHAPL